MKGNGYVLQFCSSSEATISVRSSSQMRLIVQMVVQLAGVT